MKRLFLLKSRKTVNNRYWYFRLKDETCYHSTGLIDDKTSNSKEKAIKYIEENVLTKRKFNKISQEKIKDLLFYNNCDGLFYWKKDINNSLKKGSIAGTISNGRCSIKLDNTTYLASRLVWIYFNKKINENMVIDHIDHNPLNNKIENLREVSIANNNKNHSKHKNNTSGCTGVCWSRKKNKWIAKIGVNNKVIEIGKFILFEDAIQARKDAELEYGFYPNHGA